jgi:hypothetical protein
MNVTAAITFATVLLGMLVAHTVADHWIQTDHQAATKGAAGWRGRWACARHVATYTAATAGVVGLLVVTHLAVMSPLGFLAGQLVSAVTHYWGDRIVTMAKLASALGSGGFYRMGKPRRVAGFAQRVGGELDPVLVCVVDAAGRPLYDLNATPGHDSTGYATVPHDNPTLGTGAYALDQAWHWLWLLVAALLTALV